MKIIEPIREDEMVSIFLKTEIESARFQADLLALLDRDAIPRAIIDAPDLDDPGQNEIRAALLGEWRGYRRREGVFRFVPEDAVWRRCLLLREEIPGVRYINDDYWIELSGGSRLIGDAARNIRAGITVFGMSTDWALNFGDEAAKGARFPESILVSPHEGATPTVLEGHARMTVYCLALPHLPPTLSVIVGFNPEFALV